MVKVLTDRPSRLRADDDGRLRIRLLQLATGLPGVGERPSPLGLQGPHAPTEAQRAAALGALADTESGALNLVSYQPGMTAVADELLSLSRDRTIVTLAGLDAERRNMSWIAEGGELQVRAKTSLASEDRRDRARAGTELRIFPGDGTPHGPVSWAVLNCHEYTDVRLLKSILDAQVELLVVLTYNNATRLYWEYATADLHRLFCYIAIINVADHGGSAVFAPFRRTPGGRNARAGTGGQLFAAAGRIELASTVPIDIRELRALRLDFAERGFAVIDNKDGLSSAASLPVVPPQQFMRTGPKDPAGPVSVPEVRTIDTPWDDNRPRVAIAQLHSIPVKVYQRARYRLGETPEAHVLARTLRARLVDLRERLEAETPGGRLDFLVLPEVFLPRRLLASHIQPLADALGAIVICGLDYPGSKESENANQTAVVLPHRPSEIYTKITRSQYDAVRPTGTRMRLNRGSELLRFRHPGTGSAFGLLVCYDFSHLDLLMAANLTRREAPLDMLFVIAHNPFAALYRACCVADAHRFYQAIVMCNVAKYGGSGIFMPIRESGARLTLLEAGKGVEALTIADVPLADLRAARAKRDSRLHSGKFMRKPGLYQQQRRSPR